MDVAKKFAESFRLVAKHFNQNFNHQAEITLEQFFLLNNVSKKQKITQQDLSTILCKDKSVVLRQMAMLEKKKLIYKKEDETDKRKKSLFITLTGTDVLTRSLQKEQRIFENLTEVLTPEEEAHFLALIKKLDKRITELNASKPINS